MTDQEFQTCEDKIDAMRRRARRNPQPLDAETITAWDTAYTMPQVTVAQRKARDEAMTGVAITHGLVSL